MPFKPFRSPLIKMPLPATDGSDQESNRHAKRRRVSVEDNGVDSKRVEKAKSKPEIAGVTLGYRRPLVPKDNPPSSGTEEGESVTCSGVELYYNVLWYVFVIRGPQCPSGERKQDLGKSFVWLIICCGSPTHPSGGSLRPKNIRPGMVTEFFVLVVATLLCGIYQGAIWVELCTIHHSFLVQNSRLVERRSKLIPCCQRKSICLVGRSWRRRSLCRQQ